MKTKWKNKLRYIAAGVFLLGLIANVSLSLTDPFVHVGADLLAQTGSNSSTTGQCIRCDNIDDVDCQTVWVGNVPHKFYGPSHPCD